MCFLEAHAHFSTKIKCDMETNKQTKVCFREGGGWTDGWMDALTWLDLTCPSESDYQSALGPTHDWLSPTNYQHQNSLQAKTGWCMQACTKDWATMALDFVQANGAKEKSQGKGKKVQNKIMRDNGIMVLLWRLFCTWKPKKNLKKNSSNTYKGFLFFF